MLIDWRGVFKILGGLGSIVALLFGLAWYSEQRGVNKQIARQERVDQTARSKAEAARRKVQTRPQTQEGPRDGFFR